MKLWGGRFETGPAELFERFSGSLHFDKRLFHAFVRSVRIYPIGSLVRLGSGMLGVVAEIPEDALLNPVVRTFYCTRRRARLPVRLVDLGAGDDHIDRWESPADWNFPDLEELWSGIPAEDQRRPGAA